MFVDTMEAMKPFESKLKKIKVALFDVDGVLTNSQVFWAGEDIGFGRLFDIQDGYGIKVLQNAGIKVGIITGGDNVSVDERFKHLGVDYFYKGSMDKSAAYLEIREKENVQDENILYMGDEFFDIPLLEQAGFAATVPMCSVEVKNCVDYVTQRNGGHGAVREVVDMVRHAQGIVPSWPKIDKQ